MLPYLQDVKESVQLDLDVGKSITGPNVLSDSVEGRKEETFGTS